MDTSRRNFLRAAVAAPAIIAAPWVVKSGVLMPVKEIAVPSSGLRSLHELYGRRVGVWYTAHDGGDVLVCRDLPDPQQYSLVVHDLMREIETRRLGLPRRFEVITPGAA